MNHGLAYWENALLAMGEEYQGIRHNPSDLVRGFEGVTDGIPVLLVRQNPLGTNQPLELTLFAYNSTTKSEGVKISGLKQVLIGADNIVKAFPETELFLARREQYV